MSKRSEVARKVPSLFLASTMVCGGLPSYALAEDGVSVSDAPVLDVAGDSLATEANVLPTEVDGGTEVAKLTGQPTAIVGQEDDQSENVVAGEVNDEAIELDIPADAVEDAGDIEQTVQTTPVVEKQAGLTIQSESVTNNGLNQTVTSWVYGGYVGNIHQFSLQKATHIRLSFSCGEQDASLFTVILRGRYYDAIIGSSVISTCTIECAIGESTRTIDRCLSRGGYEVEVVRRGDANQSMYYTLSLSGTQFSSSSDPSYDTLANRSNHGDNAWYPIGQGTSIGLGKTYADVKTANMPIHIEYDVDISKAGKYRLTATVGSYQNGESMKCFSELLGCVEFAPWAGLSEIIKTKCEKNNRRQALRDYVKQGGIPHRPHAGLVGIWDVPLRWVCPRWSCPIFNEGGRQR